MVADVNYPKVDKQSEDDKRLLRDLSLVVNSLRDGKVNSALSFDLAVAPAVTTTISDARISATSRVLLEPINDAAAADYAAGAVRVASTTNGQFILEHVQFALPRTFRCSFLS